MRTLVVSRHADDEVLGFGVTLMGQKAERGSFSWLINSNISFESSWSHEAITAMLAFGGGSSSFRAAEPFKTLREFN